MGQTAQGAQGVNPNTSPTAQANSYAGPNPFASGMFDRAADMVTARSANSMARMGLTNTGVNQMQSRALNDLATQIGGTAYEADMNRAVAMRAADLNRPFGAVQALPGMLTGITQYGLGLGDVGRNVDQQRINAAIQQWTAAQNQPLIGLDTLGQALGLAAGAGGGINVSQNQPGMFSPTNTSGILSGWSPF